MSTKKMLKLKLIRSLNAVLPKHKMCVKGLGLTRMHQEVLVQDTACNRGMINKAYYLLSVEEV